MTKATKIRKNTIGNEKKSSGKLSIKMRIAFWYTGLIIGITALFIITMLNIGSLNVRNAVHNRLKRTVEKSFERIDFIDGEIVLDNNLDTSAGDIFISVYDKNGDFIYGDLYLDLETGSSFKENNKVKTVKQGNLKWYVYEIKRNFEGYGDLWIRGVTPISQPEKSAEMTIFIFLALFPFLIIISASGGYIITKKAFEPIEDITKTAEKINKGNDLSERINIGNGKDEIFTLANTFDEM